MVRNHLPQQCGGVSLATRYRLRLDKRKNLIVIEKLKGKAQTNNSWSSLNLINNTRETLIHWKIDNILKMVAEQDEKVFIEIEWIQPQIVDITSQTLCKLHIKLWALPLRF
mmetsp:Transcript_24110/g.50469  ORF Transcript_24110/g.50469 Transcript_24110/m.50469 type:complete len:111 (-) Transcript_24110:163-495(-)